MLYIVVQDSISVSIQATMNLSENRFFIHSIDVIVLHILWY
jgi:hypothetical protein